MRGWRCGSAASCSLIVQVDRVHDPVHERREHERCRGGETNGGSHPGRRRIRRRIAAIILQRRIPRQKYPSRFFFSIEPASSLSMSLPCRSLVRVTSISAMISGMVVAVDSWAAVNG